MASVSLQNCDEIVTNLFLGGRSAAEQPEALIEQGIRAVVCCMREPEFASVDFHPGLQYYRVDVEDMGREPIELFWPEAVDFIHGFRSQGEAVLVHCRAGVSRSASTVLAYLIMREGYSLCDAFARARSRRQRITPNPGFMEKLRGLEEAHTSGKSSVSMARYLSWFSGVQSAGALPDIRSDDGAVAAAGKSGAGAALSTDFGSEDSEASTPSSCHEQSLSSGDSEHGEAEEDAETSAEEQGVTIASAACGGARGDEDEVAEAGMPNGLPTPRTDHAAALQPQANGRS
eukprot:CAMPEP_0176059156 /NCGR_PEP_ID=MMETSP0120_2-20121206/29480_1 /TAXON_ID=160619 /ORGANISM="Kryptoperidinium foliaceum, Strain CCMP 1326" /LENGTH=287 /DNA_ID=CAMNT_0017392693 /DNA_START=27 /DNA_END=887 /DNA_ORIENTATION=+